MRVSVHLLVPLCTSVLFCEYVYLPLYLYVFVCICMCVCMHLHVCLYVSYVCLYVSYVCLYVSYVCVYVFVCVCVFLSLQHHLFPPLKVVLVLKKEVVKSGGGEHEDSGRLP